MQMASRSLEKPVGAVRNLASSSVLRDALTRKNAYLYIGSAVIVVAALVYLLVFYTGSKKEVVADAPDVEVSVEGVEGVADTDSLTLTASVMDTAWLTITSDGVRTQQLLLVPDGEYSWTATKKFTLSVSNAGGVRFIRNGRSLPLFGGPGEAVRSVTITRTEVINASEKSTAQPAPKPVAPATKPPENKPTTAKPVVTPQVATKPAATSKPAATKPTASRPTQRVKRSEVRSMPIITTAPPRNPIERPTQQKPPN